VEVGECLGEVDRAEFGDDQHLGVDHVQQQRGDAAHVAGPRAEQADRPGVTGFRGGEQLVEVRCADDPRRHRAFRDGPVGHLGLQAPGPAARARRVPAFRRQVRDVTGRRARTVVHHAAGGYRGVDHVAHEQVHEAGAGPDVAEQLLGPGQRARVALHVHRQCEPADQQFPGGHVVPAQLAVVHDHAGGRVHPAAGGDADAQRPAALRVPGQEVRDAVGRGGQHGVRRSIAVRPSFLDQHASAQVDQRHGGVRVRDVHAADDVPVHVDVHRHVRSADADPRDPHVDLTH
jgi:hypothetical protein